MQQRKVNKRPHTAQASLGNGTLSGRWKRLHTGNSKANKQILGGAVPGGGTGTSVPGDALSLDLSAGYTQACSICTIHQLFTQDSCSLHASQ